MENVFLFLSFPWTRSERCVGSEHFAFTAGGRRKAGPSGHRRCVGFVDEELREKHAHASCFLYFCLKIKSSLLQDAIFVSDFVRHVSCDPQRAHCRTHLAFSNPDSHVTCRVWACGEPVVSSTTVLEADPEGYNVGPPQIPTTYSLF